MRDIQMSVLLLILNLMVFAPIGAQAAAAKGALCRDLFRAEQPVPAAVKGHLDVSGRRVYFEHIPAQDGKPTAVIFNGLFVPASDFVPFKKEFQARTDGEGVLIFTYSSQFDSMAGAPAVKVEAERASLGDYAEQAEALLRHLAVRGPVVPVGFSYGSAPATVFAGRNQIRDIIFVSPLVFPGETAPGVAVLVEATEAAFAWNPFGGMWMSQMREQGARTVASKLVAEHLKVDSFPEGVVAADVESGLIEMIRAADEFNLTEVALPKDVTSHFILAGEEAPARRQSQDQAIAHFEQTNPVKVTVVAGSEHHVIGLKPKAAAVAILKAMRGR
ncbi:MAG: alpha/beta hydrolase [Bdellovibrionales bacterium]|nr:alpha/beta hydrolase [Bdellovibrionales bacterium]